MFLNAWAPPSHPIKSIFYIFLIGPEGEACMPICLRFSLIALKVSRTVQERRENANIRVDNYYRAKCWDPGTLPRGVLELDEVSQAEIISGQKEITTYSRCWVI